MKPKLFLDFDGCIVDSIRAIVDLYNDDFQAYPNFRYMHPDDIHTWNFTECECATKDAINAYFNVPRFFKELQFMPMAQQFLYSLSKFFDIYIVSFGEAPNLKLKKEWIAKFIPYAEFIGLDFDHYVDKSCVDMENSIYVDDTSKYLYSSNAKHKFIFGEKYPWNSNEYGYKRCSNWMKLFFEIMECLGGGED